TNSQMMRGRRFPAHVRQEEGFPIPIFGPPVRRRRGLAVTWPATSGGDRRDLCLLVRRVHRRSFPSRRSYASVLPTATTTRISAIWQDEIRQRYSVSHRAVPPLLP